MAIQIDVAELSGLVVEAGLYGIYLMLFIASVYIFAARQRLRIATPNSLVIITAVCMILLATTQLAVDTANIFVAFLYKDREDRVEFLLNTSTTLFAIKHCILIMQLLIGDLFVIYRCWIVWGQRIWVVVLPVCLSLGSAASGSYAMWVLRHNSSTTVEQHKNWVAAFITLSLCANAVATSLLAFRIWHVDRRARSLMGASMSSILPIVTILIESGALNATYLFIYSVTLLAGSQSLEFMAQIATPMSGIVFCIVIIQVGLNTKKELDCTVDHRMASLKFAADNQSTMEVTASSDTETGTLSHICISDQRPSQVPNAWNTNAGCELSMIWANKQCTDYRPLVFLY